MSPFFTTQDAPKKFKKFSIKKIQTRKSKVTHFAEFPQQGRKDTFSIGQIFARVTKNQAKRHVSSFLQQNDISFSMFHEKSFDEEPSPRNQYLFNGDFATWPKKVNLAGFFFHSKTKIAVLESFRVLYPEFVFFFLMSDYFLRNQYVD